MLPRREQQRPATRNTPIADRPPHLAVPLAIDLADDRVVADVLLDRVFERFARHGPPARPAVLPAAPPPAAWRCARADSARSPPRAGTTGRFVRTVSPSPAACSARSVCLTIRSSSEWNVMTASRPPGAEPPRRVRRGTRRARRARGSPRCGSPGTSASPGRSASSPLRGIARRTMSASCPVVSIGARCARRDDRPRDAARVPLLAELVDHVGQRLLVGAGDRLGGRRPADVSMRMSSGSSRRKLKPRPGASSCIDDTPRSASTPSTPSIAARVEHLRQRAVVAVHQLDPIAERRAARRARCASAAGSRSRPISRDAPASSSARACPPSPTVQSTNSPPRDGARCSSTSATMTGSCTSRSPTLDAAQP